MINNYIVGGNIQDAWLKAYRELLKPGVTSITPLSVSIILDKLEPENIWFDDILNSALKKFDRQSIQTTAGTIFPQSLYNPGLPREKLFERYLAIWPYIKKAHSANRSGVYFERLINFGSNDSLTVNQLEHVISTYDKGNGNSRRSALQASIFDPLRDHTNQRQKGFPCLQLVSFTPFNTNELAITGVYATQYLFDRAYGNYLGLYRLGKFMAKEMGLNLTRLNCIATNAKIGSINKAVSNELLASLENEITPLVF